MASFNKKDTNNKSGVEVKKAAGVESPAAPKADAPTSRRRRSGVSSGVDPMEINRSPSPSSGKDGPPEKKKDNKMIIGIAVAVVLIIIIFVMLNGGKETPAPPVTNPGAQTTNQGQTGNQTQTTDPNATGEPVLSEEERLKQELLKQGYGVNDVANSDIKTQAPVESEAFVKDLQGADVKEMYTVKTITYIQDFVSYTRHRAVTDAGIEIYWLDGEYKGKKCKLDIKYKHFQTLSDTGVVLCNIEVVETVDGNKIITWFGAVEDPLGTLNKK